MSDTAPSTQPGDHEAVDFSLVETSDAFNRIADMREKAQNIRTDLLAENASYDPVKETLPIVGGNHLLAGYIGKFIRNIMTETRASLLDKKAERLTRRFTEKSDE